MLSVWWDWKGVVFFVLLQRNRTINSDVYCRQLNKLNAAIKEKRPELINCKDVIFYYDKITPHTSLATRQKLFRLAWEVILHPRYSPELAPSDYYLFRSLQNFLNDKTFNDDETVKSHLVQFFAYKDQKFYQRGNIKLPERWRKVIEQKEKYITDLSSFLVFKKMWLICIKKSAITSGTTQYVTHTSTHVIYYCGQKLRWILL